MHVRRIACQEHSPVSVGRSLPRHVGESGYPSCVAKAVVGSVTRNEAVAEIAQRRRALTDALFTEHDAHAPILPLADRVDSSFITAEAPRRLFGELDVGDQVAGRRVPS